MPLEELSRAEAVHGLPSSSIDHSLFHLSSELLELLREEEPAAVVAGQKVGLGRAVATGAHRDQRSIY